MVQTLKKVLYIWDGLKPMEPLRIGCIDSFVKYYPDVELVLLTRDTETYKDKFTCIDWMDGFQSVVKYFGLSGSQPTDPYSFGDVYRWFWLMENIGCAYIDTDMSFKGKISLHKTKITANSMGFLYNPSEKMSEKIVIMLKKFFQQKPRIRNIFGEFINSNYDWIHQENENLLHFFGAKTEEKLILLKQNTNKKGSK